MLALNHGAREPCGYEGKLQATSSQQKSYRGVESMARSIHDTQSGADIAVLLTSIDDHDDPRDAYALVQERIREYRSAGWMVPEELIRVERSMMTEFMAESQGR
jgi:hypothetical protein